MYRENVPRFDDIEPIGSILYFEITNNLPKKEPKLPWLPSNIIKTEI